jgi:hypothetical protein
MAVPLWKGFKDLAERPESPDWDFSGSKKTCTRTFEGPYDKCLDKRPKLGQNMADIPLDYFVSNTKVKRIAGAKGALTITMESYVPETHSIEQSEPYQPQYEIEWVEIERKLEQHPRYQTGGAKAFTDEDFASLPKWEDEADPALKKIFKFTIVNADNKKETKELSENAKDLATKKLRGQESYIIYSPVARRTSQSRDVPVTSPCGKRQTPAVPSVPSGYVWLKTADRATRTGRYGKWERIEEWTGADFWDEDIYPTA